MDDEILYACQIADCSSLKSAVKLLDSTTKKCGERQLYRLHRAGYLPTGIYEYLLTLRKAFPDQYVNS